MNSKKSYSRKLNFLFLKFEELKEALLRISIANFKEKFVHMSKEKI